MLSTLSINNVKQRSLASFGMKIGLGVVLLFLCTQLIIPLKPVPITLQSMAVLFIALTFERRAAMGAVLTYLALGSVGMPVFSHLSAGVGHLFGPTGGYLFGFVMATILMTTLRDKLLGSSLIANLLNCAIGTLVIFTFGTLWLSNLIGFEMAIKTGVMPFIIPGIIKAMILCACLKFVQPAK